MAYTERVPNGNSRSKAGGKKKLSSQRCGEMSYQKSAEVIVGVNQPTLKD